VSDFSKFFKILEALFDTFKLNNRSLDNYFDKGSEKRRTCPKWNYFILKFQFFLLYFLAAIKKIDMDWLSGYSMRNLSKHKVLSPFRYSTCKT